MHVAGDFWEVCSKDELRTRYGTPGSAAAARRGRAVAQYDEAGLVTVKDGDVKGNVLDSTRRLIADTAAARVRRDMRSCGHNITTGYRATCRSDRSSLSRQVGYRHQSGPA
ncbi:hypothetical protein [Pseudonocardia asaccharolytica]|uniref:Uncharacterized protein n=1 Tax=Pseudonocardia asaccharolytica DSM 44247 = NBRC 16224 TaxID=1123024 RepID=A0A511D636_9PSEU|nr:hypothetical protein [Pseudonocardia asaccharolytica]GEL20252.1 hypothetical protein PA7_40890 [Pseudonocardia asaccharolytica DSM 44247 = NBRC 16224]